MSIGSVLKKEQSEVCWVDNTKRAKEKTYEGIYVDPESKSTWVNSWCLEMSAAADSAMDLRQIAREAVAVQERRSDPVATLRTRAQEAGPSDHCSLPCRCVSRKIAD